MSVDNVTILSSAHDNAVKVSPIVSVNLSNQYHCWYCFSNIDYLLKELLDKRIKTEEC